MLRALGQEYPLTVLSFDGHASELSFRNEPFRVVVRPAPPWRAPRLFQYWLEFVRSEARAELARDPAPAAVIATTSTLAAFDVCPPGTARIGLVRAYENFGLLCPWVPFRQRINLGKLAAVRRFQDPRLMRHADAVLTNSLFMRSAISSRFGTDEGRIYVLGQTCEVTPSDVSGPPNTIGFVTRGPEKGLGFVMQLARKSPDLRYIIYGHDRDLPDTLPPNVEWRGWASDRNAMFASASLWLVPSQWAEPFGRVSIEAQAADRAVLVAASGGLPETVKDERYRIEGFNPDRWLSRMRLLQKIDTVELKRNGEYIRSNFSSDAHDAKLKNAMTSILGSPMENRGD